MHTWCTPDALSMGSVPSGHLRRSHSGACARISHCVEGCNPCGPAPLRGPTGGPERSEDMYRSSALTLDPFHPHTHAFPPARGGPLSSRACRVGLPRYIPPCPVAPSTLPRRRRFFPPTRGPLPCDGVPGRVPPHSLGARRVAGRAAGVNPPFGRRPTGYPPPVGRGFCPAGVRPWE